jgi:NADP-dependent 3-hydroxy acid dehydrogenase YdfG
MRSLDKGENIKSLAQKEKLSLNRVELDISDDVSVKNVIQSITAESCSIDVLVNNAFLSDASPYNGSCRNKGVALQTILPKILSVEKMTRIDVYGNPSEELQKVIIVLGRRLTILLFDSESQTA